MEPAEGFELPSTGSPIWNSDAYTGRARWLRISSLSPESFPAC